MLKKLLRFDIKSTGKILLPLDLGFLILSLLYAASYHLLNYLNNSVAWLETLSFIFMLLATLFIVVIFACCMVVNLLHFYHMLGDEGYLMFTLPVTPAQQIASKLITSMLWMFIAIAEVYIFARLLPNQQTSSYAVAARFSVGLTPIFIVMALIAIAGIAFGYLFTYACCAIGSQWGQHRLAATVITYFIFNFVAIVLAVGSVFGLYFASNGGDAAWFTNSIDTVMGSDGYRVLILILGVLLLIFVAIDAILWAVTQHLLSKKLNLA